MSTHLVRSEGIFHGLPTYPDSVKDLTAIITGANGISGYHMVKALAAAPQRWKKIYCLSRRPPPDYFFSDLGKDASSRVEHVSVDFLSDPAAIAESLRAKIQHVDHVFFFSYMHASLKSGSMWADADALVETNSTLLGNFIEGLKQANLIPRRFLLQTGAKHYGFHIGPATNPSFESDPRITLEPNFYYSQEDILASFCKEHKLHWNVTRPSYIIGAVRGNLLNHAVGLAVYASVQAHLGRPIIFPSDYIAWDREHCQSSAMLNGYFSEWCVLSDTEDEAFNIQDGQPFTWGRMWPYLASWYGVAWEGPEKDESKYRTTTTGQEATPRGYGPPGTTRYTFTLREWSENAEVVAAWDELVQKHSLQVDPFKDRAQFFGTGERALIGGWPLSISMRKARQMGFYGTTDPFESMFECIKDLVRLKVSAPIVKEKFEEVIS